MKRLGVYDNSTIIITGDHGFADSRTGDLIMDKITALFVKPAGETHKQIKKSKAQVSHDNLWATIFKSEGIAFDEAEFGKSVFDVDENVDQVRSHVWHKFDSLYTHYEEQIFAIKGSARKFKNWKMTSKKKVNKELYS
jgi:arylsulfatase A-like enzyme